jgi:hypothetical protein
MNSPSMDGNGGVLTFHPESNSGAALSVWWGVDMIQNTVRLLDSLLIYKSFHASSLRLCSLALEMLHHGDGHEMAH